MAEAQSLLKSLFYGVIPETMVFPFPEVSREEREHTALLLESVRKFIVKEVDSAKIDREAKIPETVMKGIAAQGLFGLRIPSRFGGKGLSTTSYARVLEELATLDGSIALTVGAHGTLGLGPLLQFGTDAQQKKYLSKLAAGESIAAFALTEPGAGSDAAGIATRARVVGDGVSVQLDGEKCWIANAPVADVFTIFARTTDDEGSRPRLTAYLVERSKHLKTPPSRRSACAGSPWAAFNSTAFASPQRTCSAKSAAAIASPSKCSTTRASRSRPRASARASGSSSSPSIAAKNAGRSAARSASSGS